MNPLVSVLMTAYNREKYIAEAIESVLASTHTNFELIIVDDASTDNTVSIARKYEAKDNRIKVYVNEKNLGDYPNRNKAASYARGKYLMFVDSDDKILHKGIEQCIFEMEKNEDVPFGLYFSGKESDNLVLDSSTSIKRHFFEKPFLIIGPGGTILNREFFEQIGGYPVEFGPANDMYFDLKVASLAKIRLLNFEFMYYRIHDGQEFANKYNYLYNNYNYINAALTDLPLPLSASQKEWISKKNKRRFTVNILKYFFKTFNFSKTNEAIHKSGFKFKDALIGIFH